MIPTLSILIPTVVSDKASVDRRKLLARLMDRLDSQLSDRVIIQTLPDGGLEDGGLKIGAKRQKLLEDCATPFLCFVDDDDLVSRDYCNSILAAIDEGADVVGFRLRCYTNGDLTGRAIHSLECKSWSTNTESDDGLFRYERTPNHLNPIRRELALQIGYKPLQSGEDADYSNRLFEKFGASMKEVFIDKPLYDYLYRTRFVEAPTLYDNDGRLTLGGMRHIILSGGSVTVGNKMYTKVEQLDELPQPG